MKGSIATTRFPSTFYLLGKFVGWENMEKPAQREAKVQKNNGKTGAVLEKDSYLCSVTFPKKKVKHRPGFVWEIKIP